MITYEERFNNLLERLDPKYMAILDEVEQMYPYSVAKIKNELANNLFYLDLTYGCVMSLVTYLDLDVINMHTISLIFSSPLYKDKPIKQSVDNGIQEGNEYMGESGE
jgi:hypothetical protein